MEDDLNISFVDIIIKVKPGETINLTTSPPSIVIHNTWSTFLYRYTYSENKHKLLTWLTQMVYSFLDEHKHFDAVFNTTKRKMFHNISNGIRNLSCTYSGTDVHEGLSELAKKIEGRLLFI